MAPPPKQTLSEWADENRVLSPEGSAEPGRWKTSRAEYQRGIMDAITDPKVHTVAVRKPSQVGWALDLDTPIPTPDGWTTMGAIRVGNRVFDETGAVATVRYVSPVYTDHDCYRIEFSDGAAFIADANHRWYVESESALVEGRPWPSSGRIPADKVSSFDGVLSTKVIAETYRRGERNRYAVPVSGALDCPNVDLPIDPYFLGCWLGDGHSRQASITSHEDDAGHYIDRFRAAGLTAQIAARDRRSPHVVTIRAEMPRNADLCTRGHDKREVGTFGPSGSCRECSRQDSKHNQYGTPRDEPRARDTMGRRLAALGVLGNKHIPAVYLRAGREQRAELLRGLMDTDGSVDRRGRAEFYNTSPVLMDQVVELMASLGLKPSPVRVRENGGGRDRDGNAIAGRKPIYAVSVLAYTEMAPVSLPRKFARLKAADIGRSSETRRRRIVKVEKVPSVPVRCIEVDSPSHLFLAGRAMVPTHNTELVNNVVGYFVDRDPASILVIQPTVKMAENWSKKRLSPMLRDTPCLRGKIKDAKSRDSDNTILEKGFPGGYMAIVGANTPNDLASRPMRIVLADEVDKYPASAGDFGDPLALASSRQTTFWNRKTLVGSTPGDVLTSTVERKFREGDQRYYHVPCPHCGHEQVLAWEQVVWEKDEEGHRPETAAYACEASDCGTLWSDAERWRAIRHGRWIASAPFNGVASFAITGFMSPWMTLEDIVRKFLSAKDYAPALRQWVNEVKGEPWEERGESSDADALANRLEVYDGDTLPEAVRLVTAGVDTQDDRLEVTYAGWGEGEEAWIVRHDLIMGDTAKQEVWDRLDVALRDETFSTEGGQVLRVRAACVDSGGHRGAMVLGFARNRASRRIYATKGIGNDHRGSKPIWGGTMLRAKNAGDRLWAVGVDTGKDDLAARLRILPAEGEATPRAIHFPAVGLPVGYFDQLTAEQAVTEITKEGRKVRRWKMKRGQERNEALDCFILAHAAMLSLGVRLTRRPPRTHVPMPEDDAPQERHEPPPPPVQKQRPRRRVWEAYR